jgi:hypothetical protein
MATVPSQLQGYCSLSLMPMAHTIMFFASLVCTSVVFALLEIQIEGQHGWASALPTWTVSNKWTRLVLGGRPFTGYHLYVQLFFLLMLHLPYGLGLLSPSIHVELRLLSFGVLFWILEDFLWFVFNPAFGIRKFSRSAVWWHSHAWWWIMPREYWLFTPIGIALYVWSCRVLV